MTRKILVATDLSAAGDEAVRQAHAWARMLDASLVAYHVIPSQVSPAVYPLFPQLGQAAVVASASVRAQIVGAVQARVAEVTGLDPSVFETLVDEGAPYAAIARKADDLSAELVVVGAQGSTGLAAMLLGGVATQVIRYAQCAVLVTRRSEATGRVLAATDFSDPALPAVVTAAEVSRRTGVGLTVLHSVEVPSVQADAGGGWMGAQVDFAGLERQAGERLRAALASIDAKGDVQVSFGGPASAIVAAAEAAPTSLIVVGTVGRTGLKRLLLGNTAETVVRNAHCSVLVERLARRAWK